MAKKPVSKPEWDRLVDRLFEADKANPYLGQTVEGQPPPKPKKETTR